VATFALLGMINWIYQWYRPEGRIRDTDLAEAYIDLFLGGLLLSPPEESGDPAGAEPAAPTRPPSEPS
jgi:hypothetical protein